MYLRVRGIALASVSNDVSIRLWNSSESVINLFFTLPCYDCVTMCGMCGKNN
jgi:hypothetical protein